MCPWPSWPWERGKNLPDLRILVSLGVVSGRLRLFLGWFGLEGSFSKWVRVKRSCSLACWPACFFASYPSLRACLRKHAQRSTDQLHAAQQMQAIEAMIASALGHTPSIIIRHMAIGWNPLFPKQMPTKGSKPINTHPHMGASQNWQLQDGMVPRHFNNSKGGRAPFFGDTPTACSTSLTSKRHRLRFGIRRVGGPGRSLPS